MIRSHDYLDGDDEQPSAIDWQGVRRDLAHRWKSLLATMLLGGVAAVGLTFVLPPKFQSTVIFLPPQQGQGTGSAALSSLNSLATLAGAGVKTSADQYAALMQTTTVREALIARFKLMNVYGVKYHAQARQILDKRTKVTLGKKDGLISVQVEDENAERAADIANQYVEELRKVTSTLAVSEAQQRRVFFENQLRDAKNRLIAAQEALQDSGFGNGAIKAEPQATAESYARLRAQLSAEEVRLQSMRTTLSNSTPEVQREQSVIAALRGELAKLEANDIGSGSGSNNADYVGKYREFKYQETLFELMAKQYESAKLDEAREGALIQVVDRAQPAERRSFPVRSHFAAGGLLAGAAATMVLGILRNRRAQPSPSRAS